jgi:hypothetical protein
LIPMRNEALNPYRKVMLVARFFTGQRLCKWPVKPTRDGAY